MAIKNLAIKNLPSDGGQALAKYLAIIWQVIVILGSLFVLLYLAWGALDWILSGSNPDRLKRAKDKIFNSLFGLVFLALTYLIIKLVGLFLGINILNPDWPTF